MEMMGDRDQLLTKKHELLGSLWFQAWMCLEVYAIDSLITKSTLGK